MLPYVFLSVFNFIDLTGVEVMVVLAQIARDTTQAKNVAAAALWAFIRDIPDISTHIAMVVRNIDCEVWDILCHSIEDKRFQSIYVVLNTDI